MKIRKLSNKIEWLTEAIRTLESDEWWTHKNELDFAPIDALEELRSELLMPIQKRNTINAA
jgi:hypothetical protein